MSEKKHTKLLIKNMVCQRCVMTVESILSNAGIKGAKVLLGEVELQSALSESKLRVVDSRLEAVGFELIQTKVNKIVDDIKKLILEYISSLGIEKAVKLSTFITSKIHYDYSYLSDLFSSIESITIEQFFILQRIERVKELLVYEELSLTEISYQTGFSSVHHLSAQFKKVTGLTPSHFKKIGSAKRKSIDKV